MATVTVFVHSPSTRISSERRLASSDGLFTLRGRLEHITGIPPDHQRIQLWALRTDDADNDAAPDQKLIWDSQGITQELDTVTLASIGTRDGMGLKVLDTRPPDVASRVILEDDDPNVESYQMTDEEYQKRQDTVLAYKQRNKLGRFDPASQAEADAKKQQQEAAHSQSAAHIPIGARCQLLDEAPPARRGTVRFIGPVAFAAPQGQAWVGVEFDEPVGKNDGSVQGHRYFTCAPRHGGFVKADKVEVGNFPPRDDILGDDGDDDELDEI